MLGGLNDAAEDARRVVRLLAPLKSVKVNLIPWNPGELPYRESSAERIEEFRRFLVERGVPAFVPYSRGRDVMAACRQLPLLKIDGTPLSMGSPLWSDPSSTTKKRHHLTPPTCMNIKP